MMKNLPDTARLLNCKTLYFKAFKPLQLPFKLLYQQKLCCFAAFREFSKSEAPSLLSTKLASKTESGSMR